LGEKELSWDKVLFTPQYSDGEVVLLDNKKGKAKIFATVPMNYQNAVTIPEFVPLCAMYYRQISLKINS